MISRSASVGGRGWAPEKMWGLWCCFGSLPSRIREAGINGLRPAARVPSIYSVSPLRVLDRKLPEQPEGHCNLRSGRFCESPIRKSANLLAPACEFRLLQKTVADRVGRSCFQLGACLFGFDIHCWRSFNVAEGFTAISSWYLTT